MGTEANQQTLEVSEVMALTINDQEVHFSTADLPLSVVKLLQGMEGRSTDDEAFKKCPFHDKIGEMIMQRVVQVDVESVERPESTETSKTDYIESGTETLFKVLQKVNTVDPKNEDTQRIIEASTTQEAAKLDEIIIRQELVTEHITVISPMLETDALPLANTDLETAPEAHVQVESVNVITGSTLEATTADRLELKIVDSTERTETTAEITLPTTDTVSPEYLPIVAEQTEVTPQQEVPVETAVAATPELFPELQVKPAIIEAHTLKSWIEEDIIHAESDSISEQSQDFLEVEQVEIATELAQEIIEVLTSIEPGDIDSFDSVKQAVLELLSLYKVEADDATVTSLLLKLVTRLTNNNTISEALSTEFLNYLGTYEYKFKSGFSSQFANSNSIAKLRSATLSKYVLSQLAA